MISIIICSRHKDINRNVYSNIEATIGTDFEIVWIDNSENKYSMCSAYNEGVRRAKGEYLCFMHEDIEFMSKGWGIICLNEFEDDDVWMLGVVGTTYLDAGSIYWCFSGGEVGHAWTNGKRIDFRNDIDAQDVMAIDGFWMIIRKDKFEKRLHWDDATFGDFDMYDMDLSLQVISHGARIRIVDGIDINHLSAGIYSPVFYDNLLKFHEKWDYIFPVAAFPITREAMMKLRHSQLIGEIVQQKEMYYLHKSRLYKILMSIFYLAQKIKKLFQ